MKIKWNYFIYHGKSEIDRNSINSIDINPFQKILVTGGVDSLIKIWNIDHMSLKQPNLWNNESKMNLKFQESLCKTFEIHKRQVNIVRWSLNGKILASGGDDGRLILCRYKYLKNFDQYFLKIFFIFKTIQYDILFINWSPDSNFISTISLSNIITVYSVKKKYIFAQINSRIFSMKGSCWDPLGCFFVTQSESQGIKIWDVLKWKLFKTVEFFSNSKVNLRYPQKSFLGKPTWTPCGGFLIFFDNFSTDFTHYLKALRWDNNFTMYKIFFQGNKQINNIRESPRIYSSNLVFKVSSILIITTEEGKLYIWAPNFSKIILSIKNLCGKKFSDLSWRFNGYCLFLSTSNGEVFSIKFRSTEIGKVLKNTEHMEFIHTSLKNRRVFKTVFFLQLPNQKKVISIDPTPMFLFKTKIIKEIILRTSVLYKNFILFKRGFGYKRKIKKNWEIIPRNLKRVSLFKKKIFITECIKSLICLVNLNKDWYYISIRLKDKIFYLDNVKPSSGVEFSTFKNFICYLENKIFITAIYVDRKNSNLISISKINFKRNVSIYETYIKAIKLRNHFIYIVTTKGIIEILKADNLKGITLFDFLAPNSPLLNCLFKSFFKKLIKCSGLMVIFTTKLII